MKVLTTSLNFFQAQNILGTLHIIYIGIYTIELILVNLISWLYHKF